MIRFNVDIKLFPGGKAPQYMTKEAAGADCYVREVKIINKTKDFALVEYSLGFALGFKPGFNVELYARSSSHKLNHFLSNGVGICDSDYRGEYKAVYYVFPDEQGSYEFYSVGDRCAQIKLVSSYLLEFTEREGLEETERNQEGFGSTGNS
jgi:dUTP pyrophosphatase